VNIGGDMEANHASKKPCNNAEVNLGGVDYPSKKCMKVETLENDMELPFSD